jgi:pilus assembly protein CpaF
MSELDDNPLLKLQPLKAEAVDMFFQALSPLKELLDAPELTEIMVNDHRNIWIEHRGVMSRVNVDLRPEHLEGAIHALASSVDKSAHAGSDKGIINAGHRNLRIAAVMNPTAIDGHALSIRKHRESKMSLDDYVRMGAFARDYARPEEAEAVHFEEGIENEALVHALKVLVHSRKNVLVAGGTSAGKTTFLNALVGIIPEDQRVITIEDTMELRVQVPNRVRLLSNPDTNVTTQLLVALCLRLRPDRIIVGEVRGGEGYDLLQALNTGHDGGLASLHANNARTALSRLESLAMLGIPPGSRWELDEMRKHIADCFNYVVHFKRTDEMRHVSEILEIRGFRNNDYDLRRVF